MFTMKTNSSAAATVTNSIINTKFASITKSNSASATITNTNSNEYLQQEPQQKQQQLHLQLQHLQHNKDMFLKNYIVSHYQCGPPEPLRIIETVIAEDAETNANTPESQNDTNTSTSSIPFHQLYHHPHQQQHEHSQQHHQRQLQQEHSSADTMPASSTSSSLPIYTALPQSYSFSPPSTITFPSYMSASVSVPTSVSAASTNTSCNNKFTRKRERVCNSNSNNTISKMAYCKAFSK